MLRGKARPDAHLRWRLAGSAGGPQATGCAWLLWALARQYPLRAAGAAAVADTLRLLRPTGLLVARTAALSAPLALSTALAARTDGCDCSLKDARARTCP